MDPWLSRLLPVLRVLILAGAGFSVLVLVGQRWMAFPGQFRSSLRSAPTAPEGAEQLWLVALTLAVWAFALSGAFQFDDYNVIVNAPAVHGWDALAAQAGSGIRPVLKASYALSRESYMAGRPREGIAHGRVGGWCILEEGIAIVPGAQISLLEAEPLGKLCVQVSFVVAVDRAYQLIQLIEHSEELTLVKLLQRDAHTVVVLKADVVRDVVAEFHQVNKQVSHLGADLLAGLPCLAAQVLVV